MRVVLTTLSNHLYSESRTRLKKSALLNGIEEVYDFDFEEIKSTPFYSHNLNIMSNEKFMGFWLWKPYIILEVINKLNEGDILVYADAGLEFIGDVKSLINVCLSQSDIIVFGNANDLNASWTKRDCFVLMDCDTERFWYASHCDASLIMLKKCSRSIEFLTQWLHFGCNDNIISNIPNSCGLPNRPEYIEHRYDQSILSVLAEKFKLPLFRMPSQFGNHYKSHSLRIKNEFNCINQSNQVQLNYYHFLPYYNSDYRQIFNHHRTKNVEFQETKVEITSLLEQNNESLIMRIIRKIKSKLIQVIS